MAILDETNLAAAAAKRATFRVHHVGTKLNEGELAELEALKLKRGVTHGELIRGLILGEVAREKEPAPEVRPSVELVEIVACRLLLTNLLRPVATSQPMDEKQFNEIAGEVRKQKAEIAHKLLKGHDAKP